MVPECADLCILRIGLSSFLHGIEIEGKRVIAQILFPQLLSSYSCQCLKQSFQSDVLQMIEIISHRVPSEACLT